MIASQPTAPATTDAVCRALASGEVQTATTPPRCAPAARASACSHPAAESGGSRRPRINPLALSAVSPCRASRMRTWGGLTQAFETSVYRTV